MSWQRSIQAAIRSLQREEASLNKKLGEVRQKVSELEALAKSGGPGQARKKATSRRLSQKGRSAISKAAKKRWAAYRREKRQQELRRR